MTQVINRILNKWIIGPFTKFIKTGLSPEKLARSFALGICLGTMPVPGSTITCTIAAIALKLNFGAIQLINYMVAPLQLLLIYPLFKAGAVLTGSQIMSGTLEELTKKFRLDAWGALMDMGNTALAAVLIWLLISIPVGFILYKISLPIFMRISHKNNAEDMV